MKTLLVYRNSDGAILYGARVTYDKDAAFYPQDPATQGALEIPANSPAYRNQQQYKVVNGQLVQKNIVQVNATSQTFPADGKTAVSLTFTNLNASAVVNVAGRQVTVSPTDNVLTLTSDAPRSFQVQVNDADQYSDSVEVEAV